MIIEHNHGPASKVGEHKEEEELSCDNYMHFSPEEREKRYRSFVKKPRLLGNLNKTFPIGYIFPDWRYQIPKCVFIPNVGLVIS